MAVTTRAFLQKVTLASGMVDRFLAPDASNWAVFAPELQASGQRRRGWARRVLHDSPIPLDPGAEDAQLRRAALQDQHPTATASISATSSATARPGRTTWRPISASPFETSAWADTASAARMRHKDRPSAQPSTLLTRSSPCQEDPQHLGSGLHRALAKDLGCEAPQRVRQHHERVVRNAADFGHGPGA